MSTCVIANSILTMIIDIARARDFMACKLSQKIRESLSYHQIYLGRVIGSIYRLYIPVIQGVVESPSIKRRNTTSLRIQQFCARQFPLEEMVR